jgi:hypothetical protein
MVFNIPATLTLHRGYIDTSWPQRRIVSVYGAVHIACAIIS